MLTQINPDTFIRALDLVGTLVFGVSGGVLAVRKRLDIFGAIVLAICAGLAGGVFRDLVIGKHPPSSFVDSFYILAALCGGLLAFFALPMFTQLRRPILVLDAVGLGLFAISGCSIALAAGISPFIAAVLGVITAVGGGIVRDVLVGEIPVVFDKGDIYAFAALAGAGLYLGLLQTSLPEYGSAFIAIIFTVLFRLISVKLSWSAPRSPWMDKD